MAYRRRCRKLNADLSNFDQSSEPYNQFSNKYLVRNMTGKHVAPFPVLTTERLTLRQLRRSDAPQVVALRSNEHVNKYLDRRPSDSLTDARNFIHTVTENGQRADSFYWAITLSAVDNVIGTVCLFNLSENASTAEMGYELLPDFQGKGFMHEALVTVIHFGFQQVRLQAIDAYTHIENHPSISVVEKLHFKRDRAASENVTLFKLTRTG